MTCWAACCGCSASSERCPARPSGIRRAASAPGGRAARFSPPSSRPSAARWHGRHPVRAHARLVSAVDAGAITLLSAAVVWGTRVRQDGDTEVAAELGVGVSTLQRRRQRAERELAKASFSGRGVCQYLAAEAAAMFVSVGSARPMSPYQLRRLTSRTDRSRRSERSETHSRETRSHARHHRVPLA